MKPNRLTLIGLLLCVLTSMAHADPLSAKLENARFQNDAPLITLDFVLTNHSKEPIRIAERWNTWGAYQWRILMKKADGSSLEFTNPQMIWTRNFLSVVTIEPGRELRTACVLALGDEKDDMMDERSPIEGAELFVAVAPDAHFSPPLSLKGRFTVEKQFKKETVETNWIGRIESPALELAQ